MPAFYIYLMIEIQSRPDGFMPLRFQVYGGLLHQHLAREQNLKPGQLPPLFPMVIYNGDTPWNEATSLKELIIQVPGLDYFQPNLNCFIVDEKRIPNEALSLKNLMGCMVALEQANHPASLLATFEKLMAKYQADDSPEGRTMLEVFWYTAVKLAHAKEFETKPYPSSWKEVRVHMSGLKDWIDQQFADGLAEGEAKGKAEGKAEGEAKGTEKGRLFEAINLLEKLLTRKFGSIPAIQREMIANASLEQIEEWSLILLDASSLEDVFLSAE